MTEDDVRAYLLERLAPRLQAAGLDATSVPDDLNVLEAGIIDSFGFLDLIGTVEEHFGVSVDFEGIDATELPIIGPFCRFVAAASGDGPSADTPATTTGAATVPEPLELPAPALATEVHRQAAGPARRSVGHGSATLYRFASRAWAKAFSLATSGAFAGFGSRSVIQPPVRLSGEGRIAVGSNVFVGSGSWLQVIPGEGDEVAISIGDGTSIAGMCVLSAVRSVVLGPGVMLARGCYVADHAHAYGDDDVAIQDQGVTNVAPVEIAEGAWLGENAVVLPGVRIGRGAVIGANSVVSHSVPDRAIAAGVPARIIRQL